MCECERDLIFFIQKKLELLLGTFRIATFFVFHIFTHRVHNKNTHTHTHTHTQRKEQQVLALLASTDCNLQRSSDRSVITAPLVSAFIKVTHKERPPLKLLKESLRAY